MAENPKESVTPKKRGNRLGFLIFRIAAQVFGLRGAYGLLYFVCLYYVLFDRAAVRSTMPYIKRRFPGRGPLGRLLEAYRLFLSQGRNLIDRFYLVSGSGKFDIDILGYDRMKSILQDPTSKGLVLLTAHVGNWQTSMTGLGKIGRKVHLMMKPEHNEAVREALSVDGGGERIGIISPDGYLGGVIEALKAIREGDLVSIMGDRAYGADTVQVDFLGAKVRFPYGAFSIAASAGCPVVVVLTAKAGPGYVVDVTTVIEPVYTDRRNKMRDMERWAGEFASALERYVEKYPYQWFVFHDLWAPRETGDGDE